MGHFCRTQFFWSLIKSQIRFSVKDELPNVVQIDTGEMESSCSGCAVVLCPWPSV